MRGYYLRLRNLDAVHVVGVACGVVGVLTLPGAWGMCGVVLMMVSGMFAVLEA